MRRVTAAETGQPIVFDATHSVRQPGGQGATSGGQREFAPILETLKALDDIAKARPVSLGRQA